MRFQNPEVSIDLSGACPHERPFMGIGPIKELRRRSAYVQVERPCQLLVIDLGSTNRYSFQLAANRFEILASAVIHVLKEIPGQHHLPHTQSIEGPCISSTYRDPSRVEDLDVALVDH